MLSLIWPSGDPWHLDNKKLVYHLDKKMSLFSGIIVEILQCTCYTFTHDLLFSKHSMHVLLEQPNTRILVKGVNQTWFLVNLWHIRTPGVVVAASLR